jgi:hypothetical protein
MLSKDLRNIARQLTGHVEADAPITRAEMISLQAALLGCSREAEQLEAAQVPADKRFPQYSGDNIVPINDPKKRKATLKLIDAFKNYPGKGEPA